VCVAGKGRERDPSRSRASTNMLSPRPNCAGIARAAFPQRLRCSSGAECLRLLRNFGLCGLVSLIFLESVDTRTLLNSPRKPAQLNISHHRCHGKSHGVAYARMLGKLKPPDEQFEWAAGHAPWQGGGIG
jgi:hypothetical protein